MKTDQPRRRKKPQAFDEVDARIAIPVATRLKMQMNRKMNGPSEDARLLRSGIDQYRSLQHLNAAPESRRGRGAESALQQAQALVERRQFNAAIPYFTEALAAVDADAAGVKMHHQRGLCYLAAKKYKAAIEDFSKVMQLTPKSAELYAKRGKAYAAMGEHHAAMLDYNEAINLAAAQGLLRDCDAFPGGTGMQLRGLYLARARVYKALNNITHALEDLGHAESAAGGHRDPELFYERAQLYLQCHQDSLALQDLDRFVELQEEAEESRHFDASGGVGGLAGFAAPSDTESADARDRTLEVLLERAKVLQRLAMEEDQRERKDAELVAVEQGQGGAKKSSKSGKGSAKLTHLSPSSPPKPEPYRGIESRRLEKRALHDYSKALELDAENADALRLRGEACMHLARYDDALADFARAFELDPKDFQVPMARAQLFRQRGDLKAAVEEVTGVLRVNGFFINGLFLRARLYEELREIEKAQHDYTSIIEAHFDIRGGEKTLSTGKVTMELASGGTLTPGAKAAKNGKTGSSQGGKITSEVAARALLHRARLSLASEHFDAAAEDYARILESFSNNMEAQLELQETRERKAAFEERKQREAVAWLEKNADELDGTGVLNANSNNTTGKSKKKKRKKKKKGHNANASNGNPPAGYVLLEDEEELLQQREEERRRVESQQPALQATDVQAEERTEETPALASADDAVETNEVEETADGRIPDVETDGVQDEGAVDTTVEADEEVSADTEQPAVDDTAKPDEASASTSSSATVVITNVMTRDEAWESMWDEEADEPIEEIDRHPMRISRTDVSRSEPVDVPATTVNDLRLDVAEQEAETEADHEEEKTAEETNEDASGSSDDGKDSQGKAKTVLVDDKYLRKREKQLRKLRESLQQASDERDKDAIDEALARAERKQMSDALQEDIDRARRVLADIAEARIRDSSLPSASADAGRKHLHTVSSGTSPSNATKPPSLVIRPIAYGQALQAAEQHQQQLRAHEKLLEEKDAEIARLTQLLAQQAQGPSTPADDTQNQEAATAALARRVARLRSQFPIHGAAARQAEALVEWMGPSEAADRVRQQVLSFVQRVISAHFPLAAAPLFFATGSYPMKTYLPTSDLDICLLVPQELETSWYFTVMQALCIAGGSGGAGTVLDIGTPAAAGDSGSNSPSGPGSSPSSALLLTNTVRNVSFINADVRVIKCTVDNIAVDLTANRVGALGAVRLLDAMAVRVGREHLFKKSLILIKSWCTHESSPFLQTASAEVGALGPSISGIPGSSIPSSVMGASHGAFSTYAVNTIVMALFNYHGDALTHPLQALYLFLDRLAEFPWHEAALTLHGVVPLSRLATTPLNGTTNKSRQKAAKLDAGDVEAIRETLTDQFGAFDAGLKSSAGGMFPIRACNIVDPLDDKNNLARSVSAESFPVIKRAFRLARDQLAAMLAPASKDDEVTGSDVGMAFFPRCWQLYGRGDGWRPDLLIHPRQVWHGKPASTSSAGSAKTKASPRPRAASASPTTQTSDEDEDRRWESLLPTLDPAAASALILQHQQLQQAAAAYHGAIIAYQQPYFIPPQHGIQAPVMANGGAAASTATSTEPYYRRPYGSPGGGSQRSKSPPPTRTGKPTRRRYDSPPPK